ncbi:unnamed protein product [Prorocentrum cordatum]|uniref:Uncharacterized protein n=1 Tax=Prorocentrum cordatum TaxID=2364126 RepID=A0ABN9W6H4_9DINO|nr:unnamed protein product [Polarella glacialis]
METDSATTSFSPASSTSSCPARSWQSCGRAARRSSRAPRGLRRNRSSLQSIATTRWRCSSNTAAVADLNFYASEDAFVRGGGAYVNIWDEGTHPSWRTHSYVADLLSRWCNVVLDKLEACDIDAAVPDGPALRHPEDFRPDEIWMSGFQKKGEKKPRKVKPLNMSNVCLRPFTKHSAYEPSPTSPRSGGGWRLYEDRPEKPGWIASSPSDWLWFPVQLGPARGLIVQYLRSYENLGDAEVLIRGPQPERVRNLTLLPGLWERATSETETEFWFPCDLYDARCGNTAKSRFHRLRGLKPGNYTVGFRLANGTGNKFKLITLLTC